MTKLLRQFLGRYRLSIVIVLGLLLAQALTTLYLPALNADIINNGVAKGDTGYIINVGALMLVVTAILGVCSLAAVYLSAKVAMGFGRDVRLAVFRRVGTFSQVEMNKFGTPSLITRNTNDVQQVQMIVFMGLTIILLAPIMGIGGVILALRQDVPLSGLLVVILPIMFGFIFFVTSRAVPLFRAMQTKIDRINQVMREALAGVRVIRAFVRVEHEEKRFDEASTDLFDTALRVNRLFALTFPVMMLIFNLSSVAVMWFGASRVESGDMPIGNLTAFLAYLMQILFSVLMAIFMIIFLPRAVVSASRIREVLETEPSVVDPETPVVLAAIPAADGDGHRDGNGRSPVIAARPGVHVEFKHVEFRYPGAEQPILHDISFSAEPGQTTAIIGSTGSGKSTLDQPDSALLRRDRRRGARRRRRRSRDAPRRPVEADRRHPADTPSCSAARSPATFATAMPTRQTSRSSRARYRPGERIRGASWRMESTRRSIRAARTFRVASASASRSPARWSSARRCTSSTTASARSTSAPTRGCARRYTASWRASTVIIVAQRVGTILNADQIIVMDEGRIVGVGTHRELLESSETYREIVYSQLDRSRGAGRMSGPDAAAGRSGARRPAGRPAAGGRAAWGPGGMMMGGLPPEKSKDFGRSFRRLLGRLRPERSAHRGRARPGRRQRRPSPSSGQRSWATRRTSSSQGVIGAQTARRHDPGAGRGGAARRGPEPARRHAQRHDRRPRRRHRLRRAGQHPGRADRRCTSSARSSPGARRTSWPASRSAPSTDCAHDVDQKLGRLPLKYFDDHSRGDVLSRVTNDIDNIGQTLQQSLTQLITSVLTVIGVLIMMITISWELALISVLAIPRR